MFVSFDTDCTTLFTGFTPGPLIFGTILDKACILWQDSCGQQGSCLYYSGHKTSQYLFWTLMCSRVAVLALLSLGLLLYKPPPGLNLLHTDVNYQSLNENNISISEKDTNSAYTPSEES